MNNYTWKLTYADLTNIKAILAYGQSLTKVTDSVSLIEVGETFEIDASE